MLDDFSESELAEAKHRIIEHTLPDSIKPYEYGTKKEEDVMSNKKLSRFLARILRHRPELIGISLDEHGWANVDELICRINDTGREIDFPVLKQIVAENDKQRFSFNEDESKIRANHGHTVVVDIGLAQKTPPEILYHGTLERNVPSINDNGLIRGKRLHVHLSVDKETAMNVAARRKGVPVIYEVFAKKMNADGYTFYQTINGIWLTKYVPVEYLRLPSGDIKDTRFG